MSTFALPAVAVEVNTIQPAITVGQWSNAFPATPGTLEIVDVAGEGGNLENNAPLGTGVVKMQTTGDNSSRAEVRIVDNFGTVGSFIQNGTLSYDYYHESGAPNPNIAPAIKFEILDYTSNNGAGYATFIYEPTYNGTLSFDDWNHIDITGTSGNFWHMTLYGENGLIFNNTFDEWNTAFNSSLGGGFLDTFLDANIFSISLGLGSGTPGQTGYIDNVNFSSLDANQNAITLMADFETLDVAAVPLPATLPLYGTGLAALGLMGWRKRRRASR